MDYTVTIDTFEGPLDLLLHLIKQNNIEIEEIHVATITEQYLDYIKKQEEMNLDIASEYLSMAAELIEMKSSSLLPRKKKEDEDEFEENAQERLIKRLLEYQQYKNMVSKLRELEEERSLIYTKEPSNLKEFQKENTSLSDDITLDKLLEAFQNLLKKKEFEKPLHTKVTKREYSVSDRSHEIRTILKQKKQIAFQELFEEWNREYIVVTFLSILDLAKKQEVSLKQEHNFEQIVLTAKERER
ncbi:MAG: segregation/condensation protein A [Firmicutes bacterium]|nr:segregation/condensation protein A [Bacillota bacterium]